MPYDPTRMPFITPDEYNRLMELKYGGTGLTSAFSGLPMSYTAVDEAVARAKREANQRSKDK